MTFKLKNVKVMKIVVPAWPVDIKVSVGVDSVTEQVVQRSGLSPHTVLVFWSCLYYSYYT